LAKTSGADRDRRGARGAGHSYASNRVIAVLDYVSAIGERLVASSRGCEVNTPPPIGAGCAMTGEAIRNGLHKAGVATEFRSDDVQSESGETLGNRARTCSSAAISDRATRLPTSVEDACPLASL
jgi:hypothetical protein